MDHQGRHPRLRGQWRKSQGPSREGETFVGEGVDERSYKTKLELNLPHGKAYDGSRRRPHMAGRMATGATFKLCRRWSGNAADQLGTWAQISQDRFSRTDLSGAALRRPNGTDGRAHLLQQEALRPGRPARTEWQPKVVGRHPSAGSEVKTTVRGRPHSRSNAGTTRGEALRRREYCAAAAPASRWFDPTSKKWPGRHAAMSPLVLDFYRRATRGARRPGKLQQDQSGRDQ